MKTHKIKIQQEFAEDVLSGRKNFEVRYNDRSYQTGDKIQFSVVNHFSITLQGHELSNKEYVITYMLSGFGIKEDWVVFGFKEATK